MRGQAYVEYLVVVAILMAALAYSAGNDSPLAHLADAVRYVFLSQVAATAAPPLPLACGDGASTPVIMMATCND